MLSICYLFEASPAGKESIAALKDMAVGAGTVGAGTFLINKLAREDFFSVPGSMALTAGLTGAFAIPRIIAAARQKRKERLENV